MFCLNENLFLEFSIITKWFALLQSCMHITFLDNVPQGMELFAWIPSRLYNCVIPNPSKFRPKAHVTFFRRPKKGSHIHRACDMYESMFLISDSWKYRSCERKKGYSYPEVLPNEKVEDTISTCFVCSNWYKITEFLCTKNI